MKRFNKISRWFKGLLKDFNSLDNKGIAPSPVFWRGKDITGKYHDKKDLQEFNKKRM